MKLIDKDALVAEIERRIEHNTEWKDACKTLAVLAANQAIEENKKILSIINSLEVKEVDNVWHEVDNVNLPQPDKNKIYCVLSKNKYLLARVINHPQDEDLLQWKCTEYPFLRYDMCEGDMYMEITNAQKGV